MQEQVSLLVETVVKPGGLDTFKTLMEELVEHASEEPGTLNYEWYVSDDGGTVHIYERYADSEAVTAHATGIPAERLRRFAACVEVTRATVYGDPSPRARELMAGFGPTYLGPWGGFARS
jgi:quinol monooxygenase YgiN